MAVVEKAVVEANVTLAVASWTAPWRETASASAARTIAATARRAPLLVMLNDKGER